MLTCLDVKPERYSLRMAAKGAATGESGSVFYDLDVPDFSQEPFSLSGLILSAATGPPTKPHDPLASMLPLVPTTRRGFTLADQVTAFLRVDQGERHQLRRPP